MFHCMLRPEEARSLTWNDIVILDAAQQSRFKDTYGVVAIKEPKTRRLSSHAVSQHVLIEDQAHAMFLGQCKRHIRPSSLDQPLWTGSPSMLGTKWRNIMATFNLHGLRLAYTIGCLRVGGATEHYLVHRNVSLLRRRGRWVQVTALDRYVQEGVAAVFNSDGGDARAFITKLSVMGSQFITNYRSTDDVSRSEF